MLRIIINKNSNIQGQIVQGMIDLINTGVLRSGDLLPSINSLSSNLKVSRTSVIRAYERMESLGYLKGKERSGFIVMGFTNITADENPFDDLAPDKDIVFNEIITEAFQLFPDIHISDAYIRKFVTDTKAINTENKSINQLVSNLINIVRRININDSNTIVSNNINELIIAIAITIKKQRENPVLILEEHGCIKIRSIFQSLGFIIITLPVDANGMKIEQLASITADCLYLTPSHHYPTGSRLSQERRDYLNNWLNNHKAWLIEDDSSSLLYLKTTLARPFTFSHSRERSIYLASLKSLVGCKNTIAIGYFPPSFYDDVAKNMNHLFDGVNNLLQSVAYEYMQSNRIIRDISRLLQKRRSSYEAAVNGVRRAFPQAEFWGQDNALYFSFSIQGNEPIASVHPKLNIIHIKNFAFGNHILDNSCVNRIVYPYATIGQSDVLKISKQLLHQSSLFNVISGES